MDQPKSWIVFIALEDFSFDRAQNEGDILENPDQLGEYIQELNLIDDNWDYEIDGLIAYSIEATNRREALFCAAAQAWFDERNSKGAIAYACCTSYGFEGLNGG